MDWFGIQCCGRLAAVVLVFLRKDSEARAAVRQSPGLKRKRPDRKRTEWKCFVAQPRETRSKRQEGISRGMQAESFEYRPLNCLMKHSIMH